MILVTGTPGVGKTEFSIILSSKIDAKHVDLGSIVKKENLYHGMDEERGTLIVAPGKVTKRLMEIMKKSKQDVIIDGHNAVDVVPKELAHLVFVLRRDPEELQKFMEKRGFKNNKLWENLAAEILDVCLCYALNIFGVDKVCEIDLSYKKMKEAVREALEVLAGKRSRFIGIVDWLGKLEREGRLDFFFKYLPQSSSYFPFRE